MAKLVNIGRGVFPDLAWTGQTLQVVMGIEPARWLELSDAGVVLREDTRPYAYFPRTNGVETFYSDGTRFRAWKGMVPVPTDVPMGNCPTEIDEDGAIYWQTMHAAKYLVRMRSSTGVISDVRGGAPTGIWEALRGTVLLWDECFAGGTTHAQAGVMVSERKDNDGLTVHLDVGYVVHLVPAQWVYWPRVAVRNDGTVAIAWSDQKTGSGAWVWLGTTAELRTMGAAQPPPPVPPSVPPTPPTQEPPMKFTDAEKATLIAFDAAFPVAAIPATPEHEDDRRAWTLKLAQTFKARFGGWGTKKNGATAPQSKDALARWIAGTLWAFDTTLGTTPLTLNPNAEGEDITGQNFIEVEAHDWLATAPPPPDPGVPPTDADLAALAVRVGAIERWLADTFRVTPF